MYFRWNNLLGLSILNNHLVDYPSPSNINYMWSFGFLSAVCLVIQLITGIFLAMHYTPHIDLAFASVEHIMRDVNNGWLLRYLHANGASVFFIIVYTHIFRGLYFGSYQVPRQHLWASGVTIFLIMMGTGFLGYVLPWGQMSFWGATVITNLVSAIPFVGEPIVIWVWGGFSVDNATLNRFFVLHFVLPFVIAALALVHILLLHKDGSNNPLGIDSSTDKLTLYPYFVVKDIFAVLLMVMFLSALVYFAPDALGHPDNYIPANPLVTPAHIVPEWYFLPFYAILRSIPDKLGGVVAMVGAILILYTLPYINTSRVRSSYFKPIYRKAFWLFFANFLILGWIGQKVVETPFIEIGQVATLNYALFFVVFIPLVGIFENYALSLKR